MTEQLLMENYLLILKSTVEVYVHGTLESSNQDSRSLLQHGLEEILKSQSNCYKKMTEYGWYIINNIGKTNISKVYDKLCKKE